MDDISFEDILEEELAKYSSEMDYDKDEDDFDEDDYNALCDKIYNMVIEDVKNNLSQMKPQIIQSIISEVRKWYETEIDILKQRISALEYKQSAVEGQNQNLKLVSQSDYPRVNISEILEVFRCNGWIYYINQNMGNFLYKVKENGTQNTQLTDYSIMPNFSVKNGYLCFDRKIKL